MPIYWNSRLFSRHISRTQSIQQNIHIIFLALVALKLLVSLISRLIACSARIVGDRRTDRHVHRMTTVTLAAHARRGLITISNQWLFLLISMKTMRFMGYYRDHHTAATELSQAQYSTLTTEYKRRKNKQEVQLLGMAIHVYTCNDIL